jgi:hypothetical protein
VCYTDDYPDELPKFSLEPLDGEIDEEEMNDLLSSSQAVVSLLACEYAPCSFTDRKLGTRKHRDGDDLYRRLTSTRAAINAYSD